MKQVNQTDRCLDDYADYLNKGSRGDISRALKLHMQRVSYNVAMSYGLSDYEYEKCTKLLLEMLE